MYNVRVLSSCVADIVYQNICAERVRAGQGAIASAWFCWCIQNNRAVAVCWLECGKLGVVLYE